MKTGGLSLILNSEHRGKSKRSKFYPKANRAYKDKTTLNEQRYDFTYRYGVETFTLSAILWRSTANIAGAVILTKTR